MAHSIITISRTYASGGREIGRKLAERLGFAFYDRAYMLQLAREQGLAESLLSEQEEHTPTSLLYSLVTGSCVVSKNGLQSASLSEQLFAAQTKLIRAAAEKEPMVIVGRCADSILAAIWAIYSVIYLAIFLAAAAGAEERIMARCRVPM